jgi:diguanylate cyclase (GGDEF)-like protein
VYANQKYLDRFSPENNNIKGLTVSEVLGSERYAVAGPNIKQVLSGKTVVYDWQPFHNVWQMVSYVPTEDVRGKITGYYVMISDITDRKLAEIELYNISHFDALTCLANETQFTNLLNEAIESAIKLNQSFPLIQVNIQNLSEINDALGFSGGDQALQEFAERLRLAAPLPYKIARLRGDEFAILLDNCSVNEAISLAGKIEKLLVRPIVISNIALDMSAKMGIAVFPEHGSTPHDLYRHIDFAVRQAKKKGTSFQLFDRALDSDKPHRLVLAAELRYAIDHNHLELYLQPKIDFITGQVCGAEALVRWDHAERGMIYPDEFIPLAEQIGLIKPLTQWVIDAAMRLINTWGSSGFVMPIAVNISAKNLHEDDLVERVSQLKANWNIGAELFEIEVTESSVMSDAEYSLEVLRLFQEQGIVLSIDDFGTGYSSLSYLQRLPVHSIKIDKSFVQNMLSSKQSLMIVRSTIDLAHDLGRKVVAEGVETREHLDQLANLGCDIAQGYFIAKPMPVDAFINWVNSYKSPITAR